ncbi:MAG: TIGR03089 family protein [bacterium]
MSATSPERLFSERRRRDPSSPFLTFYDDTTGERAELSAASLGNWMAKTHFLLGNELGLGPGDRAAVGLPLHWLQPVVLLGCWSAGLEVLTTPGTTDVAFADVTHLPEVNAAEVLALALQPWGRGFDGPPPPGTTDYVTAVRPQPDAWAAVNFPAGPDDPALDGVGRRELVDAAGARAGELDLADGARVLVRDPFPAEPDVLTLVAVLAVGGSLVLVRHGRADAEAARVAQEGVTAIV